MPSDPFVPTLKQWMQVSMQHTMRNFLHFARESGLSMSHLGAIFHIDQIGTCGVTEIGDHLGVTSAAASQLLDRLVHQGLVQRREDPRDRRVKQIALTSRGQEILKQGIRARESWLDQLAETLSDSEKETITSSLSTLISRVNRLD
jgi:DNA-binding MarR family transcriptional regulator